MVEISRMLRMERDPDANLTTFELLQRTPLEQLEQTVKALKKQRPAAEVRQAMVQLIAAGWPPLFQLLTHESRDALVAVREFSGTSGHAKPAQDDELGLPAVGFAHTVRRFQEL